MSGGKGAPQYRSDGRYTQFYEQSVENPAGFWAEQGQLIDWHKPCDQVLYYSNPPFVKWFVGGQTNLCYNAIDRHLKDQADKPALIFISTETGQNVVYTSMIAEAAFAMLACARIGAIHSVVFGGFASHSLASRIDDAQPKVIVSADAGSRGGKIVAYKPLLDGAIGQCTHKPFKVLMVDRGLVSFEPVVGRDVDYAQMRQQVQGREVPVTWLEATDTSYILYTSGTTGKPKGVQRDVGGYAVALAHGQIQVVCR